MKKDDRGNHETDALLKNVLADDLPLEAEKRMKERLLEFREAEAGAGRLPGRTFQGIWNHVFRPRLRPRILWMPRKAILAFSSILMIAFGGFLHISSRGSALADTFSLLNASISVSDRLQQTESMFCTARVSMDRGINVTYLIRWLASGASRLDVRRGGDIEKTLWITGTEIIIADNIENTSKSLESLDQIESSLFDPIIEFLSPERLSEVLYYNWKPRRAVRTDEDGIEKFFFENDKGKTVLEMTVDLKTYLPMRITKSVIDSGSPVVPGKIIMEVDFEWNQPIPPQYLDPAFRRELNSYSNSGDIILNSMTAFLDTPLSIKYSVPGIKEK
ncbi:MAG: hypothetical protein JXB23_17720 [Candidatus Aminicenantes bacterium]|nr:hypothetical protein [Candidatus Aminicenantes bacterium]